MARVEGYNERKGAQVVAYFANKCPNSLIEYLKAVKLVYLADRESLARFGFPILDDDHYSLPMGPVNSCTKDYLSGDLQSAAWSEILSAKADHRISSKVKNSDDLDELSEADIEVLDAVWAKFGHMTKWELVDWTHDNLPEWEDPDGGATRIPFKRTLEHLGIDEAAQLQSEILSQRALSAVFKRYGG